MRSRLIQDTSTLEPTWREWLAALAPPTRALDAWLGRDDRLVIIAPHPDDEVLACGGLLFDHHARGGRSLIVAVTDGEASHAPSAQWDAVALAHRRNVERLAGLRALGLDAPDVVRLGLPDGRAADPRTRLTERLLALMAPTDVVVATWRLDGHPDHDAAGSAAAQASAVHGCRLIEAPVWMWHWAEPDDPRIPWHRLHALELGVPAVAHKRAALSAHVTQLTARDAGRGPVLDGAIIARALRGAEYFFV